MDKNRLVKLGHVAGVYGVKGWLKIYSETDPVQNIVKYSPWFLKQGNDWKQVTLLQGKKHGKGVIAQLESIEDRDQAATLKGCEIAVRRGQLPQMTENEGYYWADLEGLSVVNLEGVLLGRISHLFQTGANDVMVLEGEGVGERERLVPFIREQVVHDVDLEAGRMLVDWDPEF